MSPANPGLAIGKGTTKKDGSSVKTRALTGNTTVRIGKIGKVGKVGKEGKVGRVGKTESKKRKERKKNPKNRKTVQKSPLQTKSIKKGDSKELKRHLFIFKSLTKKAKDRDIVLKKAPLTLYKTIRLLFKLIKRGSIPLNNKQRHRLKPWANFIRDNSTGNDSTVKSRVSQNGDGLGSILKTILPIIAPILSMII